MTTPSGDGAHAADPHPDRADHRGSGATRAGQETRRDVPQVLHHDARPAGPQGSGSTERTPMDRVSVVNREKNAHGGVKVGSAFFGWLTATGTAVLLTALLAATGTAIGVASSGGLDEAISGAQDGAAQNAGTIGLAGGIAVLVVLLVSYFCGGYVAGRMARFNGVKQGVAVWVWAVVIAVVVAVLAAVAGNEYDVLGRLNSFPRIPVDAGSLTTGSIIALVAAVVVALVGAVLGGLAGMRFHRRVDRAGLGR
jgi:hypothetical protein